MPKNHGIYCKTPAAPVPGSRVSPGDAMRFRYGINGIFEALRIGNFLPSPDERRKAAQLEAHFRTLCQRFVYGLQELNGLMQALLDCYGDDLRPSNDVMRIHFHAECLADHTLTYLNTLVDDVATMIALATAYVPANPRNVIDSMGKLRSSDLRGDPVFGPIKHLLDETDTPSSWWDLGFAKGSGARQLMIHNHHLVGFQLSRVPGQPAQVTSHVMSHFAVRTFAISDYFGVLRDILSGLFGWLDRLEIALVSVLQAKDPGWSPPSLIWSFLLPVGYPPGTTIYQREYFPIPTCDGSDDLPWTITIQ